MGGKRGFTKDGKRVFIHRWQKSVYYLWVVKKCVLYMGGKRVFYYIGWKRSFHHGRNLSFRPRRQKFGMAKIQESIELQPFVCYSLYFTLSVICQSSIELALILILQIFPKFVYDNHAKSVIAYVKKSLLYIINEGVL